MTEFDYNTIIGRDPELFAFHIDNVQRNAGIDRERWRFNVYIYYNETIPRAITDKLVEIAKLNRIEYECVYEDPRQSFLVRLYNAWNRVQLMGTAPLTIRGGSDQTFYPGSFARALEHYKVVGRECIVNFNCIESPLANGSRHYVRDFGTTAATYKEGEFISFCDSIKEPRLFTIKEAMERWEGKPGAFNSSLGFPHYRGDSVSWLQSKELFKRFGPMPALERGFTGDVIIHDRYERAGFPSFIAGDAISYHMVRGESRGQY
jgi:hypothetical protein